MSGQLDCVAIGGFLEYIVQIGTEVLLGFANQLACSSFNLSIRDVQHEPLLQANKGLASAVSGS